MKTALLIPLAFLAGAHGFALFAPYLALALAAAHLLRRRPRTVAPATAPSSPFKAARHPT